MIRSHSLIAPAFVSIVLATGLRAQESRAVFDAPVVVAGEFQMITDVADRDGDGWSDAYGWWESDIDKIQVSGWRNDHAGNLVLDFTLPPIDVGEYVYANESAVGDLDGDGRDDYVLAVSGNIYVFHSNGLGAPTLVQTIVAAQGTYEQRIRSVLLADFTGDGHLDIAWVTSGMLRILGQDP